MEHAGRSAVTLMNARLGLTIVLQGGKVAVQTTMRRLRVHATRGISARAFCAMTALLVEQVRF